MANAALQADLLDQALKTAPEVQVLLTIDNRGSAQGAPFYLVRNAQGHHALARQVGDLWKLESGWVDWDTVLSVAMRVAGGEPKALTHPNTTRGLAIALIGIAVSAQEAARDKGKPEAGPLADVPEGTQP